MTRDQKFKKALKLLLTTESGLYILKCLKEDYIDTTSLHENPHVMAYKLGQKEFVQTLISTLTTEDELRDIDTQTYDI